LGVRVLAQPDEGLEQGALQLSHTNNKTARGGGVEQTKGIDAQANGVTGSVSRGYKREGN
jgi:hypothetical protein